MLTPSLEDYLEEIFRFSFHGESVRVSDLSGRLQVSLPSVSKALNKLKEKDYIQYQAYGDILLTEKGKALGRFLVERNKLLQDFLGLIGSNCNIHAEAEAIEHYLSIESIRAIRGLVNFMRSNPHIHRLYTIYQNNEALSLSTEEPNEFR